MTGGTVALDRFQQLFLAIKNGKMSSDELAAFVWDILSAQGQRIIKEGAILVTNKECPDELKIQATIFTNKQLPIVRALQVI